MFCDMQCASLHHREGHTCASTVDDQDLASWQQDHVAYDSGLRHGCGRSRPCGCGKVKDVGCVGGWSCQACQVFRAPTGGEHL